MILLSTCTIKAEVLQDNNKPEIIFHYKTREKWMKIEMDQMPHAFTCKTETKPWPMLMFDLTYRAVLWIGSLMKAAVKRFNLETSRALALPQIMCGTTTRPFKNRLDRKSAPFWRHCCPQRLQHPPQCQHKKKTKKDDTVLKKQKRCYFCPVKCDCKKTNQFEADVTIILLRTLPTLLLSLLLVQPSSNSADKPYTHDECK